MHKPVHLPDALPSIDIPSLFVVCGTHECRCINAGSRTLLEREVIASPRTEHTDRESEMRGPSGMTSGTADRNQAEDSRLKKFTNVVLEHVLAALKEGAKALYIAAPGRVLSALQDRLPKAEKSLLRGAVEGTFIKESSLDILRRFRPDLFDAAASLKDSENFSARKHLPS